MGLEEKLNGVGVSSSLSSVESLRLLAVDIACFFAGHES